MRKKKESRDYLFGNHLIKLRKQNKLTQFQLGRLIGVSDKAVSKWENGSAKPSVESCTKLAQVLGVTVDEILRGGNNDSPVDEILGDGNNEFPEETDEKLVQEYLELFGPRDLFAERMPDLVKRIWDRLQIRSSVEAACDETLEYSLRGSSLMIESIQDYGYVSVCWMHEGQRFRIKEPVTGLETEEIVSRICDKVSESMKLGINKTDRYEYLDDHLVKDRAPLDEVSLYEIIRQEGTKLRIIERKMARLDENGNQVTRSGERREVIHEHALYNENGKLKSFFVNTEYI